MILVAGATGMVGGETCRLLRADGKAVRALVRVTSSADKVSALRTLGCEVVTGDLRDSLSLARACEGVEAVISTVSAMPFSWNPPANTVETVDRDGQRRLIDAGAAAGVQRFLLVTFSANIDEPFPLRDAKRAAEAHLRDSGLTWTILRPSCFQEVWLSPAVGFDAANARVVIFGDGTRRLSWVSFRDVAAVAVHALGSTAAENATIELGGPEALSQLEAVRIFESAGGGPFQLQHVPVEALRQQMATAPDDMQRSFTALMLAVAMGDEIPMTATLARFPVRLRSVADYAREVLAARTASGETSTRQ